MKPSTGRARVLLVAVTVVVLVGTAVVLERALASAEQARQLRHQLVAERLFDEMERELSHLIDDEEARPFLHWNYAYVPEVAEGNQATMTVSPLAQPPKESFRVGYFQYNPDGSMVTPHNPGAPDEVTPEIARLEEELSRVTHDLAGWGATEAPAPKPRSLMVKVTVPEPELPELAFDNAFNRSARSRVGRKVQQQQVQQQQAENFLEISQQKQAPREVWVPVELPPEAASSEVDVNVSPYSVHSEPGVIVLHRVVRIDHRRWLQGLVLRTEALQEELERRVLVDNPLAPFVAVTWSGQPAAGEYRFQHGFAAPFEDLHAGVALRPLPSSGMSPETVLLAVSGMLVLVTLLGLLAVYRMVAVTLAFAEQRANFVSAVTHELKSPLTSIRMYSEMLESGMVPDEDRKQEYYTTIRTETERLTRLVNDVLTFSRIERGMPAPQGETGVLGEVVDDVVRLVGPQAEARGATLTVEVQDAAGGMRVDRDALSQVLVNLVDNALKFSETPQVQLTARVHDGRVHLQVRDHGPGVPQALMQRMFEPFVRGERELVRKTRGTGIGLALVQSLVARMGGDVEARNHPQGGFEVTVVLRAAM